MAMNNPYAAYQRYATKPQASNSAVKGNHEAVGEESIADTASTGSVKNLQIQGPVIKPVNYSQLAKNAIGRTDISSSSINLNTVSRLQEVQQSIAVSQKGPGNPNAVVESIRADVKLPVEPRANSMPLIKASVPQTKENRPVNSQATQSSSHYMENEVMTASPEKLTLMLYDGAIRFMNQAVIHIGGKGTEKASNLLLRTQDIYTELMSTLDMKYEVSKDLYNLYDFIKNSLRQANIKKDPALIREMIAMTRDLRNTWEQAMKLAKKGK